MSAPKFLGSCLFSAALLVGVTLRAAPDENTVTFQVESTKEHPRNSEGAFLTLKSGRIHFYFSQFYTGDSDFSRGHLMVTHSDDQGRTWSEPRVFVENGDNLSVMCTTALRLASGKIALFYTLKKSFLDCHPYVRISSDEAVTWSEPKVVVPIPGYISTNNDRVIQTATGRLIFPIELDRLRLAENSGRSLDERGLVLWFLSDDEGATWREASIWWGCPVPSGNGFQEPGVVELADHTLLSWARTDLNVQYEFRSRDHGENWSAPQPMDLISPLSPASIKRWPHSPALLAIYNDRAGMPPLHDGGVSHRFVRTPLTAAFSTDGGKTWPWKKVIEGDPRGEFCYTAIHFVDGAVLLAYSAGDPRIAHLGRLRIRRLGSTWFEGAPTGFTGKP